MSSGRMWLDLLVKQVRQTALIFPPMYLRRLCMSLLGHFFHAWIIHYVSKVLICFAAHTKLSISSHKLRTQGIIPSKYVSHVITERGFSLSGYDTQLRAATVDFRQARQPYHRHQCRRAAATAFYSGKTAWLSYPSWRPGYNTQSFTKSKVV